MSPPTMWSYSAFEQTSPKKIIITDLHSHPKNHEQCLKAIYIIALVLLVITFKTMSGDCEKILEVFKSNSYRKK